ncbi:MAG: type II secretion system F family protein [Lachnospiraceae bacterium]|nr:type II secretion system F family protein [Lachnospiraceae bacterium]
MLIFAGMILTVLSVFLVLETGKVSKAAAAEVVLASAWGKSFERIDLENKKEQFLIHNEKYKTVSEKKAAKKVKNWDKQIAEYRAQEEKYMKGKTFSVLDQLTAFGYQILVELKLDGNNDMIRKLTRDCEISGYGKLDYSQETNGKKNSSIYAFYMIACCVGYVYAGVMLALFLVIVMLAAGREMTNVLIFALVGLLLPSVLGIIPITSLQDKTAKRQEEIDMDFANILSKMALLSMANMTIIRMSEEAARSGEGVAYLELRRTVREIGQSVSVTKAFADMQRRCDNHYLDKLVSLISKSAEAGNANLAEDIRAINSECWLDKKHQSRRMAEKVQNKLFIPTMLMFIGILVVILVPAMSGLSLF